MTHRANTRGILIMLVAVGALSLMDGSLKTLSPHYPPLQVATLRALSALPVAVAWVALSGGFADLLRARFSLHLTRAALSVWNLALFTFGVRLLPLADAYAIFFVAPLLITVFAALILGERVGARRWWAIVIGFAGVLIVLRPTGAGALTLPGLAIVGTAVGYALSPILTRILGRTDTTQTMVFWLMALTALGAGSLALPSWRPIQPEHWPAIAAMAVTGSIGQWAITEAFRSGEASVIAPYEYTALAWGVALDWLLWSTAPSAVTLAGAMVIVASGLYLFRREQAHATADRGNGSGSEEYPPQVDRSR